MYKVPINIDNKPLKSDIMKNKVIKLARYYGCSCSYSGNKKTMYIHGDNAAEAIIAIRAQLKPSFNLE